MEQDKLSQEIAGPDADGMFTCTYTDEDIARQYIVIPNKGRDSTKRVYISHKCKPGQKFTWQYGHLKH